ncbi:MAG TPA: ATP-binding cassette domain-containing protein [Candidatus Sulfomarinibacteraceae bacterium]|nr:ATP-binding cassette domain-containing protein [Candidatus Sulfomarinibacteraceae bacterium]
MRVELQDIRKYFGPVKANDGISITLEEGRIYGLLGENGAGKSTLMKILSGYQPADSGHIILDGQPVDFESPAQALAAGVGMVYQDPHDFPPFNVLENYLLGREDGVRLNFGRARRELIELGSRYGFTVDPDQYIDALSMGERQQLELIRLLAGGARVLILDEPTTGISAEQKELLFDSMRTLAHEEGKTLLLVSHKLEEVQELCEHAFVLRQGKLVGETEIPCPTRKLVQLMFEQIPQRRERPESELGEPMLEIRDLAIHTYQLDVENINLTVRRGEVFGLAGLEGSGQRLLQQACAGLLQPAEGRIILDGQNITNLSYHYRKENGVAYIPAGRLEEGLVSGLTLTEHFVLARPQESLMIDWDSARQEATHRIDHYQVIGRPNSLADELSGGNQQRLLFALLNSKLKLLLLEHPTRGLDVRSADWIWEQLYQRREDGTAILFMSADLDEITERSDRIAVFFGGRMSRIVDAGNTTVEELGHLIGGEE